MHVIANFGKPLNQDNVNLYIPSDIWGTDYSKQIKNIKIKEGEYNQTNSKVTLLNQNSDLIIEYDVISLPTNEFLENFTDKYYHFFDKNKFYILGLGFFIYPQYLDSDISTSVTIHVNTDVKKIIYNIPPYFYQDTIVTNIKALDKILILANQDFGYLNDDNQNLTIFTWSLNQDLGQRINDIAFKILKQHKIFWQDTSFRQIAIFVPNPFVSKKNHYGGTIIGNTILAFVNPNINEDIDLYNLINHEGLHFWFGCNLIRGPKWFTEGFTEYYMDKINYHLTGKLDKFISNYNNKLLQYFSSPLHKLTDEEIEKNFFAMSAIEKLPYWRGYLISGQIDSIIDLDSVLRAMIRDCRGMAKKSCYFSSDFLFKYARNISSKDKTRLTNFINDFNNELLVKKLFNKSSLSYKKDKISQYNFDIIQAVNDGFITGTDLSKLNSKYNNITYPLLNIHQDHKGITSIIIRNQDIQEKIILPHRLLDINIPYYH